MPRSDVAAQRLLHEAGIGSAPVDVEGAAKYLGVEILLEPLEDDVSGMLYRGEGRTPVIAVNSRHALVRQRFTIAHELGHHQLHRGRAVIVDHLVRGRVNYRDPRSSLATDREEIEANAFGAALLMPADWVIAELDDALTLGLSSAGVADHLAKTFHVSKQAMENRLINLGLRAAP